MIQYEVITDLDTEPVDLAFFKQHARIDFDTEDALVTSYLKAARQELEQWSQLSFGVKTIGLKATDLPDNYKLMYGKVDTVTTAEFEAFGDNLVKGGEKVDIQYTTKGTINETIKIAICRYAAGLYAVREHITTDKNGNPVNGENIKNEAKDMIRPFANITLF
jgi:hypothetical protein